MGEHTRGEDQINRCSEEEHVDRIHPTVPERRQKQLCWNVLQTRKHGRVGQTENIEPKKLKTPSVWRASQDFLFN